MNPNDPQLQQIRARIARAIQELPALPNVVMRVLRETQNETISATHLEKLIGTDQAIASKALRIVNSAYYGMSKQVDTLSQAVVILGIQQLRNLVLSLSAMSMIKAQTPAQREMHRKFWTHSLATAIGAQQLTRHKRLNVTEQEFSYVAGLLHDVGRLFLFTNFTETYLEIERLVESGHTLRNAEIEALGLTHAQVGQVLAHVWKFPERLSEVMVNHEGPFNADSCQVTMAVHAAHVLALQPGNATEAPEGLDPYVAEWLALTQEDWATLRADIHQKLVAYEAASMPKAA